MIIYRKDKAGTNWSRGYTLIELLVLISILGGASAIMAMTYSEATRLTRDDMAQAMVMAQVHVAGDTIVKDVAGAYSVSAGSAGTWKCSMLRYRWTGSAFTNDNITYTISNGTLLRQVNGATGAPIAQYIDPAHTSFIKFTPTVTENHTYILTLTAIKGSDNFSSVFKIFQRIPSP